MISIKLISKIFTLTLVALALNLAPTLAQNTYKLDTKKSKIKWIGKKFLGAHWGWIKFKSGSITVDENKIISGEFEVDMNTIENEDLKEIDLKNKLVGHLKSDDFFSVAKFPTAKFIITHSTPLKQEKTRDPNIAITGKMTIKGNTQTISFPATLKIEGEQVSAKTKFDLDRTKFDVRYGSGSFFDNLGDNVIYDNFTLDIKLVFTK